LGFFRLETLGTLTESMCVVLSKHDRSQHTAPTRARTQQQVKFDWLAARVKALLRGRQAPAAAYLSQTLPICPATALQQQLHRQAPLDTVDEDGDEAEGGEAETAEVAEPRAPRERSLAWKLKDVPAAAAASAAAAAAAEAAEAAQAAASGPPCMEVEVSVALDDSLVETTWRPYLRHVTQRQFAAAAARSLAAGAPGAGPQAQQVQPLRHALRIEGSDTWSPYSFTALQRIAVAGGAHPDGTQLVAVVPIRAASGLALEVSYGRGTHQSRLRTLCQFVNATDMPLEVALLEEEDSGWQVLPAGRGAGGGDGQVVEEEVFESERHLPFGGWSYKNLLAVDPRRYSRFRDGRRSVDAFPTVVLTTVRGWLVGGLGALFAAE
jgi:hypothetical protein